MDAELVLTWTEHHYAPGRYRVTIGGMEGKEPRTLCASVWWADAERMVVEGNRLSAGARAKLWRDHYPRSMSYGPGSHPEEFAARAAETDAVRAEVAAYLRGNGGD